MHSHIDYAYPWYLSYGHLIVALIGVALTYLIWKLNWPKLLLIPPVALTLWAATAWLAVFFGLDLNGPMAMPTQNFLTRGEGKVLDLGAGTGRSSIMLLEARPKATIVSLDLFTEQYEAHFGKLNGQEKLMANFRAAGLENRATIQAGDMRQLPFENATFDGIITSYAIDHLSPEGARNSIAESMRVLKPGGEILLMVIAKDGWLTYTFGPLLMHARMRASSTWPDMLKAAGFEMVEEGKRPATLYYVARKPA